MSLNACQNLYLQALDGLVSPYAYVTPDNPGGTPLEAWITPPPVLTTGQNPQLFIWGSESTEAGATYMQTQGYRKIQHWIELHLMVADDLNSATINTDFACMIEAIIQTMRLYPVVVESYPDPTTGGVSDILFVGNENTVSYPFVSQLEPQQLVMFRALIRFRCIEMLRPSLQPSYSTI